MYVLICYSFDLAFCILLFRQIEQFALKMSLQIVEYRRNVFSKWMDVRSFTPACCQACGPRESGEREILPVQGQLVAYL